MIIYFASLLNTIEKIDLDVREILKDIQDAEDPSPFDFSSRISAILKYAQPSCTQPPLKTADRCNNLLSHLHFANHYSSKEPFIPNIIGNLNDVILHDIPAMRKWVLNYLCTFIDPELLIEIQQRLDHHDFISAVRAAFTLFSDRLRTSLNIADTVKDGLGLLDSAFKKDRKIKFRTGTILSEQEKDSFKSLLRGLYQLIRNDAAHETIISIEQADATLATLNYVLRSINI